MLLFNKMCIRDSNNIISDVIAIVMTTRRVGIYVTSILVILHQTTAQIAYLLRRKLNVIRFPHAISSSSCTNWTISYNNEILRRTVKSNTAQLQTAVRGNREPLLQKDNCLGAAVCFRNMDSEQKQCTRGGSN